MAIEVRDTGGRPSQDDDDQFDDAFEHRERDARGRFPRGKSGNPRGRPKKPKLAPVDTIPAAFLSALNATKTVRKGGKKYTVTVFELLVQMHFDDAIKGTPNDIQAELVKHAEPAGA